MNKSDMKVMHGLGGGGSKPRSVKRYSDADLSIQENAKSDEKDGMGVRQQVI